MASSREDWRDLRREYGISPSEIARQVGANASAISKAIQKMERRTSEV